MKKLTLENNIEIYGLDMLTAQFVYNEIYEDNVYLKNNITIKNGDTIFDIGANIGLFTKFVCENNNDITAYTFEPVPQIFEALEKNLSELKGNIININKGIGNEIKETEILFFPHVSADSAIVPVEFNRKIKMFVKSFDETIAQMAPAAKKIPKPLRSIVLKLHRKWLYRSKRVKIQLTTISDIIDQYNITKIDLMKIDAENYEWQVLQGIRDDHWKKIRQISMEIHSHIKDGDDMHNQVKSLLENNGFTIYIDMDDPMTKVGIYMLYGKK